MIVGCLYIYGEIRLKSGIRYITCIDCNGSHLEFSCITIFSSRNDIAVFIFKIRLKNTPEIDTELFYIVWC